MCLVLCRTAAEAIVFALQSIDLRIKNKLKNIEWEEEMHAPFELDDEDVEDAPMVGLGWVGYYNHEVLWCTSPVLTGTLATDTRLPSFPKVMKVSNRSVGSA